MRTMCSVGCLAVCLLSVTAVPAAEPFSPANWPNWRGPFFNGSAAADARPPLRWDATTNVQWVVDLPGEGSATPIVWGQQIFVLSAEATERRAERPPAHETSKTIPPDVYYRFVVTSVDRASGRVLWQKLATEQVPHEGKHTTHTYAAGSPVTDGERLYASFGSRGLYCYTLAGELVWQKDLGDMRTRFGWGEAVTPALAGELLIVNWDQEEGSFITALNKQTGETVWKVDRPGEVTSWNTPLVVDYQGQQLVVVNGAERARAYDAATGREVWSCGGQTINAIPSPLRFNDFVVCMSGYRGAEAWGIPLNSSGDVTGAKSLLWHHTQGTPYVPSPTLSGSRLYFTAANTGVLSCLDVQTGKPLVERRRLNGIPSLYASPLAANGHLYFVSREGSTCVLRDDAALEDVALNTLPGTFDASPVAVGRQLLLRSWTQLYSLAEPEQ